MDLNSSVSKCPHGTLARHLFPASPRPRAHAQPCPRAAGTRSAASQDCSAPAAKRRRKTLRICSGRLGTTQLQPRTTSAPLPHRPAAAPGGRQACLCQEQQRPALWRAPAGTPRQLVLSRGRTHHWRGRTRHHRSLAFLRDSFGPPWVTRASSGEGRR